VSSFINRSLRYPRRHVVVEPEAAAPAAEEERRRRIRRQGTSGAAGRGDVREGGRHGGHHGAAAGAVAAAAAAATEAAAATAGGGWASLSGLIHRNKETHGDVYTIVAKRADELTWEDLAPLAPHRKLSEMGEAGRGETGGEMDGGMGGGMEEEMGVEGTAGGGSAEVEIDCLFADCEGCLAAFLTGTVIGDTALKTGDTGGTDRSTLSPSSTAKGATSRSIRTAIGVAALRTARWVVNEMDGDASSRQIIRDTLMGDTLTGENMWKRTGADMGSSSSSSSGGGGGGGGSGGSGQFGGGRSGGEGGGLFRLAHRGFGCGTGCDTDAFERIKQVHR
jgi:hypothetical protein